MNDKKHSMTLEDRIDVLDEKRAVFCLKVLLAVGVVEREIMTRTLSLADVVRFP